MRKEKNFKIISLLMIFAIILCFVLVVVKNESKRRSDIGELEKILKENIVKIKMRIAIDLPEYVEFSDVDLIEEVIVCLKTIKVR